MARLYAIANQKGGVGKSTTAVNVAAYLGAWGRKTLLVDLDPQGNATSGVGIAHDASRPNIYTVLIEGRPVEDAILETNICGTYSVFEAARLEGCRRIVFASSNHAVGYYPVEQVIGTDAPPRPDTFYGLSKAFGEGLGSLYHDRDGLEAVCLRIGSFVAEPTEPRHLWTWLSHRDGAQLVRRSLEAPDVGFLVVFGVSNNRRSLWRREGWDRLGYEPEDDAEAFAARVGDEQPYRFHGGDFAR